MKSSQRRKRPLLRRLFGIMWIAAAIALGLYLALIGHVVWAQTHVPAPGTDSDCIIVLGAQVKASGALSVQLELRLEEALVQWRRGARTIVVCGAQGANEPIAEAYAMRAWLMDHGVPEDSVIPEPNSFNTRENIENALELLPENTDSVLIVTSDYHLPRAMAIARDLGLEASGSGSPSRREFWVKNYAREALAWCKYWVEKYTPLRF